MKYSRGRLLLVAALGMGAYLAALAVVDREQLLGAMRVLSPATLLGVFGLSLCNYGLRLLRWDVYLRAIAPAVPPARAPAFVGAPVSEAARIPEPPAPVPPQCATATSIRTTTPITGAPMWWLRRRGPPSRSGSGP